MKNKKLYKERLQFLKRVKKHIITFGWNDTVLQKFIKELYISLFLFSPNIIINVEIIVLNFGSIIRNLGWCGDADSNGVLLSFSKIILIVVLSIYLLIITLFNNCVINLDLCSDIFKVFLFLYSNNFVNDA